MANNTNLKYRYIRLMSEFASALGDAERAKIDEDKHLFKRRADDALSEIQQIDFTDEYNSGTVPEALWGETRDIYEQFIRDWKLAVPDGKEPLEPINLTELMKSK